MSVALCETVQANDSEAMLSGSTWRAIWQISWPLVLNMMIIAVASFVDIFVAGKLSSATQAAIGFGGQIWFLIMMLAVALSAATTALVSRFWGAGDRAQAIKAAHYSLMFALLFGIFSTAVGIISARPLLQFLGARGDVEHLAWQYLRVDLFTQVPWYLIWLCNAIFRARGNTRTPMLACLCTTTVIATLDYLFCLHPFQFGITGLALSALIASTLASALTLSLLRRSNLGDCLSFPNGIHLKESIAWCQRLLRIGLPACIQDLV
jgi:putative MATE family efflux protein